eukprot:scaffold207902_cov27-Tisochrysis_lutea.AAC.5
MAPVFIMFVNLGTYLIPPKVRRAARPDARSVADVAMHSHAFPLAPTPLPLGSCRPSRRASPSPTLGSSRLSSSTLASKDRRP